MAAVVPGNNKTVGRISAARQQTTNPAANAPTANPRRTET
jgi:hypothetical protein